METTKSARTPCLNAVLDCMAHVIHSKNKGGPENMNSFIANDHHRNEF